MFIRSTPFSLSIGLLSALFSTPLQAQQSRVAAHACVVNGCGPDGFWGTVIPNEVAGCKFKSACDAHDICYSMCTSCHPFHTNSRCYGLDNKIARRKECDANFESDMIKENHASPICRIAAKAYASAVRSMGNTYHRGTKPTTANAADFERQFAAEFAKLKGARPSPAQ